MIAQSSGLPLNIPIGENDFVTSNKYMPGAYSIGQILEKGGYHNELLIGSEAVFSVCSFSLVSEMASANSFCFWDKSSVLDGSSFRSFSTSFNWVWFSVNCLLEKIRLGLQMILFQMYLYSLSHLGKTSI